MNTYLITKENSKIEDSGYRYNAYKKRCFGLFKDYILCSFKSEKECISRLKEYIKDNEKPRLIKEVIL